ncbi:unnamed protein product [Paramecium primaurelia]|uniref:DUSP domain-containing protein n=1 Tax=Paramecium primaurelia TaxID=5886 RepID=A0A8S1L9E8_PARPR|nr:unnamed protein product [Paramecium primaurelia]
MMEEQKLNEIQLSQFAADKLKKQALEYKRLQESFSKRFSSNNNNQFYILSLNWLNQWKKYVSYDEIVANKAPCLYFGRITLDRINDDLQENVMKCFLYDPIKTHPWNTFMKQECQENVDYIVIDKDIWDFFTSYYSGISIIRPSNGNGKDKQVAVNLLRVQNKIIFSLNVY